jgi:hypothetical protein
MLELQKSSIDSDIPRRNHSVLESAAYGCIPHDDRGQGEDSEHPWVIVANVDIIKRAVFRMNYGSMFKAPSTQHAQPKTPRF